MGRGVGEGGWGVGMRRRACMSHEEEDTCMYVT
jgi:hypothetical protein